MESTIENINSNEISESLNDDVIKSLEIIDETSLSSGWALLISPFFRLGEVWSWASSRNEDQNIDFSNMQKAKTRFPNELKIYSDVLFSWELCKFITRSTFCMYLDNIFGFHYYG